MNARRRELEALVDRVFIVALAIEVAGFLVWQAADFLRSTGLWNMITALFGH